MSHLEYSCVLLYDALSVMMYGLLRVVVEIRKQQQIDRIASSNRNFVHSPSRSQNTLIRSIDRPGIACATQALVELRGRASE